MHRDPKLLVGRTNSGGHHSLHSVVGPRARPSELLRNRVRGLHSVGNHLGPLDVENGGAFAAGSLYAGGLAAGAFTAGDFHPRPRVQMAQDRLYQAPQFHNPHIMPDSVASDHVAHALTGGGFDFGKFVKDNLAFAPIAALTAPISAPIGIGLAIANAVSSAKNN